MPYKRIRAYSTFYIALGIPDIRKCFYNKNSVYPIFPKIPKG